jgi:hypothetical protein
MLSSPFKKEKKWRLALTTWQKVNCPGRGFEAVIKNMYKTAVEAAIRDITAVEAVVRDIKVVKAVIKDITAVEAVIKDITAVEAVIKDITSC